MAGNLAPHDALGVACLGITHPHTSGRVKAMQRQAGTRMLGAADDSSLIEPFAKAFDLEIRSKADILADPDVHAVLVHSKSDRMADLSIEALEAGKAVLVEKPAGRNSADTKRIVDAVERTRGCSRSVTAGASRPRSMPCRSRCRVGGWARCCK